MRKRTARGLCGSVAGVAAALALVVAGAPPAVAGGPTSVLVVSPESGQSSALYVSDKEYVQLERGLGTLGEIDKGRPEQPPGLSMSEESHQINVTWMLHDVRPWRVDRAYAVPPGSEDDRGGEGAKGKRGEKGDEGDEESRGGQGGGQGGEDVAAVWIHTSTDIESMSGTWHRAKDPARLTALFKKLGVMGASTGGGNQPIRPEADAGGPPASPPAAEDGDGDGQAAGDRSDVPQGFGGAGWWWAIPGAAVGAVGALLLRGPLTERRALLASLRGRRRHDGGPRQELRDL
ncbi:MULTISPECIES: hypothetical protein [Streptomyces]